MSANNSGSGVSPGQLSFLPDDYLQRKAQRRANVICAGLFVVVMGAIGGAFSFSERSMRDIEAEHASIDQQYTEAARRIDQVRKMQEKQRTMAQQAELTSSLLEKVPRTFVLAEITNALPGGVSLLDFSLEAKRRNVAPVAPAAKTMFEQKKAEIEKEKAVQKAAADHTLQPRAYDVTMKLTGIADNDVQVSQFITKLNRSPLFKEVNLLISDQFERNGQVLRKFQIEILLVPDADVSSVKLATQTDAVEIADPRRAAAGTRAQQPSKSASASASSTEGN